MPFNTKIKSLRLARGLTQSEVANGIVLPNNKKLSASTIGMYEQGRRKPSFEVLEAFADFFNVDLNTLHDIPSTSTITNSSATLTKKDEREINEKIESILSDMDSETGLAAYGGTIDNQEEIDLIKSSLEHALRIAKVAAKEKFTPKKYKK